VPWADHHCHLPAGDAATELIADARSAGVDVLINIGTDVEDSRRAISVAEAHDGVWATAGVHPHEASSGLDGLAALLSGHNDVVAVGETGLDYHYDHSPRPVQRRVFAAQVELANQRGLPLVVHSRSAWDDTFSVLDREGVPARTVMHCFTGGPDEAEECLRRNAMLSFSGIVTFPNADDVRDAARACPLERLLVEPHHIELQVFGDGQGNAVILGDRECSVQRRHQKVIEEAPAPAPHLTDDLRDRLYGQVRSAVAGLNYRNAGTVECLLDASGEIFFLEMNTRLQVEHPVTEMVTGLDLVEWQIRIAAGEPLTELPGYGDPPPISGHAIETRIYAEDPETLLPSPGSIDILEVPDQPWLRLDAGVASGDEVSHFYDPLMAKLIVHGDDRAQALERLRIALDGSRIEGLKHNIPFLQRVLAAQPFIDGNYDVTLTDGLLKT